jgi:hypothetical protein
MSLNIDMKTFLKEVKHHVLEGMTYRDAIQLCAVVTGGDIARLVSSSISKYQEATYVKTELSQQPNVDECALASMGKLWHGENFEGNSDDMASSEEETVLDSLYFILKYAKSENALESSLVANEEVCGDKKARRAFLEIAFS